MDRMETIPARINKFIFSKECGQVWCTTITFLHTTQIIMTSGILEFRWPTLSNVICESEMLYTKSQNGNLTQATSY